MKGLFFFLLRRQKKKNQKDTRTSALSGLLRRRKAQTGLKLASLKHQPLLLRFSPPTLHAPTVRPEPVSPVKQNKSLLCVTAEAKQKEQKKATSKAMKKKQRKKSNKQKQKKATSEAMLREKMASLEGRQRNRR